MFSHMFLAQAHVSRTCSRTRKTRTCSRKCSHTRFHRYFLHISLAHVVAHARLAHIPRPCISHMSDSHVWGTFLYNLQHICWRFTLTRNAFSQICASFGRLRTVLCQTMGKLVTLQKFCVTAIESSRFRTTCHHPAGTNTVSPGRWSISICEIENSYYMFNLLINLDITWIGLLTYIVIIDKGC